jgi:thioredoxin 1
MVGPLLMSWVQRRKSCRRKVDVDANQEFAAKYGVRNIPTVLIFHNGEVVEASRSSPTNLR